MRSVEVLKTSPLATVDAALRRLADAGVDVGSVRVNIREEAVEIIEAARKLVVLPSAEGDAPSVTRVLAELVTFLFPLSEERVQPIVRDLPHTASWFLDPLVDVARVDASIIIDSRYATTENCAKRALYPPPMRDHCFVRRSVATQLCRAQAILRPQGVGLKLWDGYRPQAVQWMCMDPAVIPDEATRQLFAPPTRGSNHARGCAVDVTLVHRQTGHECAMPTGFDSPSPAAACDATEGLTREQIENRQRVQAAMTHAGFTSLPHEWWHFNARPDQRAEKSRNAGDVYLVLDLPFEALLATRPVPWKDESRTS